MAVQYAKYFDLETDPNKTTNIVVNHSKAAIYHGLHFIMFKQGGGNLPVPETLDRPVGSPRRYGNNIPKIKESNRSYKSVISMVIWRYRHRTTWCTRLNQIRILPGHLIYIRSRIIFNSNYSNTMQIRQAFGLTGRYGTPGGWVEYSQDGDLCIRGILIGQEMTTSVQGSMHRC